MPVAKLVVVGQGYVGLPIAMRAVEVGYDVVGYDVDQAKVRMLTDATSYVEDVPDDVVKSAIASGRYRPSTTADDTANFDYAIITVPTPLRETLPDLSFIEQAARDLGRHLAPARRSCSSRRRTPGRPRS